MNKILTLALFSAFYFTANISAKSSLTEQLKEKQFELAQARTDAINLSNNQLKRNCKNISCGGRCRQHCSVKCGGR